MTNEQILELAKTCGFDNITGKDENYWDCEEEQLLKFAQAIRKETIEEVLTSLKDVPNPEANRTAINRIEWL
jgi:xanthine dehydrogenase molybdopterin-binding subunit B